ncbi:MAG: CBS domain-containing protein [Candidatus Aminicenantes bacterium]|nr:CBS domain-containing protein [Candidatus Aminicenantes bacterium]
MISKITDIFKEKGKNIISVPPDTTVLDAIKLMSEKDIGSILVMTGDQLEGIMTERDYTRSVILKGLSSKDTPVKDVMSTKLTYISPETTVTESMAIMAKKRYRHLPVFEDKKLVGIVSIGNLAERLIKDQQITINELNEYIAGHWDK